MRLWLHLLLAAALVLCLGASDPRCAELPCEADADCPGGTVCEPDGPGCGPESHCVDGCRADADCGAGERCGQVLCFTCPCPGLCEPDGSEHAQEGEACGPDAGEPSECAPGLYCALGWCGTPPVVGTCRAMGACDWEGNCRDPANEWFHIECVGEALCLDGACSWQCG